MREYLIPTLLQAFSVLQQDESYNDSFIWIKYAWLFDNEMYKQFAKTNYEAHLAALVDVDPAHQAAMTDILACCKANEQQLGVLANQHAELKQDMRAGFAGVKAHLETLLSQPREGWTPPTPLLINPHLFMTLIQPHPAHHSMLQVPPTLSHLPV